MKGRATATAGAATGDMPEIHREQATASRHHRPFVRWRRPAVALALVVALVATVVWWSNGGERVRAAEFIVGVPAEVGVAWHVGIPLETKGKGSVRLASARVIGLATEDAEPEVRLVRATTSVGLGTASGALNPMEYEVIPLHGAVVSGTGPTTVWWLDVTGTSRTLGKHRYTGVHLTYRSGPRVRTTRFDVQICVNTKAFGVPTAPACP